VCEIAVAVRSSEPSALGCRRRLPPCVDRGDPWTAPQVPGSPLVVDCHSFAPQVPGSPRALGSRDSLRSSPRSLRSLGCGACVVELPRERSGAVPARSLALAARAATSSVPLAPFVAGRPASRPAASESFALASVARGTGPFRRPTPWSDSPVVARGADSFRRSSESVVAPRSTPGVHSGWSAGSNAPRPADPRTSGEGSRRFVGPVTVRTPSAPRAMAGRGTGPSGWTRNGAALSSVEAT